MFDANALCQYLRFPAKVSVCPMVGQIVCVRVCVCARSAPEREYNLRQLLRSRRVASRAKMSCFYLALMVFRHFWLLCALNIRGENIIHGDLY